jgi:hypothetical protein
MFRAAFGNLGLDLSIPEFLSVWLRIVGPIGIQFFRPCGVVSVVSSEVWDAVHQG